MLVLICDRMILFKTVLVIYKKKKTWKAKEWRSAFSFRSVKTNSSLGSPILVITVDSNIHILGISPLFMLFLM